ncbi:MAG: acyl-CoA dehydrogenase family protein [Betaproteobacteria bacterium]|nr:acyl-CoA dehydrogenase family protein [Betaproteobacteria bacterium]
MWYFLSDEEKRFAEKARQVAEQIKDAASKHHSSGTGANVESLRAMHKNGFFTLHVPKEYGGEGANFVSWCLVQEEICKVDLGVGNTISHEAAAANIILRLGTPEQIAYYLKKQVAGDLWGLLLTEPQGGSDVGGFQTRAVRRNGKYVINGKKAWGLNGDIAERHMVWAATDPEKHNRGISVFIVEKNTPGLSVSKPYIKSGWAGISCVDVIFENVEVPEANRVGAEGDGFGLFTTGLNQGRLGIAAQSLGLAEGAYEYALDYASKRILFGGPITDKQAVRFKLADMATAIEAGRALVYTTARLVDANEPGTHKLAAMAKCHLSDMAVQVTSDALFLMGSAGFSAEHPVERMMRDAHGLRIADGTNNIMRHVVAGAVIPRTKK